MTKYAKHKQDVIRYRAALKIRFKAEIKKLVKERKLEFEKEVALLITNSPELSYYRIAKQLGLAQSKVAYIAGKHNVRRHRGRGAVAYTEKN